MRWQILIENVVKCENPSYFLLYENLLRDPINEMRNVMKFIERKHGFKQDNLEERLICLSENLQGSNKRKKLAKKIDPYTEELTRMINSQINYSQKVLDDAGIDISVSSYERKLN